jgi:hypothetical protein
MDAGAPSKGTVIARGRSDERPLVILVGGAFHYEAGDLLAKIAEMAEPDRVMAERLHALVTASAPALAPRTWYGMPAYAKDGKVVCFFQSAQKFNTRYAMFGFSDKANLDDGTM